MDLMGPELIWAEEALVERMTRPSEEVKETLRKLDGPVLILGAGGKMGPSLAELLVRGGAPRVVAVPRFSRPGERRYLEGIGVETISADLLDEDALEDLPASRPRDHPRSRRRGPLLRQQLERHRAPRTGLSGRSHGLQLSC